MTETRYLQGKVIKRSLPVFHSAAPSDAPGPKRLFLTQGELAHFYDGEEGIRYAAFIEMPKGGIRGNHWHTVKEEQIYVISGEMLLVVQDRESATRASINLHPGDLVMIACGVAHALKTIEPGHAIEYSKTRFDAADVQKLALI